MKYLDLTLPTPEANLACDEALLDRCEAEDGEEILRFWESPVPFVAVGYSNQAAREVHLSACAKRNTPVLRRCTGGGTVVQGPGCLNFALSLRIEGAAPLASIVSANRYIMARHQEVFTSILREAVAVQGHTDLTWRGRKFSGNAQRRKRRFLLFHGSFLLHLDLGLIEELLPAPSKQPAYRANRSHTDFLCNVPLTREKVQEALKSAWAAAEPASVDLSGAVDQLVREKYSRSEWNLR